MTTSEFPETPLQVIDSIRSKYRIDDPNADLLHEELNNALGLLTTDLYSDEAHFVLELVQNADDNDYKPGTVPRLPQPSTLANEPYRLFDVS